MVVHYRVARVTAAINCGRGSGLTRHYLEHVVLPVHTPTNHSKQAH
jgi:hypothetical protein